MNILVTDLLSDAGQLIAAILNDLPEPARRAVSSAYENGGWPELRIGLLNNTARVTLMVMNTDGSSVEIGRIDHAL